MTIDDVQTALNLIKVHQRIRLISKDFPLSLENFRIFCSVIIIEKNAERTINLKILASYLNVPAPTMTRYAKKLEEKGWLILEKYGREVIVIPTDKSIEISQDYIDFIRNIKSQT